MNMFILQLMIHLCLRNTKSPNCGWTRIKTECQHYDSVSSEFSFKYSCQTCWLVFELVFTVRSVDECSVFLSISIQLSYRLIAVNSHQTCSLYIIRSSKDIFGCKVESDEYRYLDLINSYHELLYRQYQERLLGDQLSLDNSVSCCYCEYA